MILSIFEQLFILVLLIVSYMINLLVQIIFYPLRLYCKFNGHKWYTTGGSWIFDTGKNWGCSRCKMRCNGDFGTLEKHGWNQNTKVRLK